jgi:hypothetical protein
MPVSFTVASRWWSVVVALLVLLVAMILLVSAIPANLSGFFGGVLIALGIMNVLFYRRFGQHILNSSRKMSPFISGFWSRVGKEGSQLLYLGIGIVLAIGGFALLIKAR